MQETRGAKAKSLGMKQIQNLAHAAARARAAHALRAHVVRRLKFFIALSMVPSTP